MIFSRECDLTAKGPHPGPRASVQPERERLCSTLPSPSGPRGQTPRAGLGERMGPGFCSLTHLPARWYLYRADNEETRGSSDEEDKGKPSGWLEQE